MNFIRIDVSKQKLDGSLLCRNLSNKYQSTLHD